MIRVLRRHVSVTLAALALTAVTIGCARTSPISFAAQIEAPDTNVSQTKKIQRSYDIVTRAWTRHAMLSANYQQVIEVYATILSPQWLSASLERKFAYAKPDVPTRDLELVDAQKRSEQFVEVTLLVSTWDRAENALHRLATSPWKVVMVNDQGESLTPVSIERDKRPDFVIRSEFPAHGDFSMAYKVRFANQGQLAPERKSITVRVFGARGSVEMTWRNGETVQRYY